MKVSLVKSHGQPVGEVTQVLHYGQDLLVVAGSGDRVGREILIPFVSAIVPEVDLEARQLRIDPPPGLLDPGLLDPDAREAPPPGAPPETKT